VSGGVLPARISALRPARISGIHNGPSTGGKVTLLPMTSGGERIELRPQRVHYFRSGSGSARPGRRGAWLAILVTGGLTPVPAQHSSPPHASTAQATP